MGVSKNGNFDINVGPTAAGIIPEYEQYPLLKLGEWLNVNGEAIYGTSVWQGRPASSETQTVFYTAKGNDLYLICTRWSDKPIIIPEFKKGGKVSLLGSNVLIKSTFSGGKFQITPPVITPENYPCEFAWVFKISKAFD